MPFLYSLRNTFKQLMKAHFAIFLHTNLLPQRIAMMDNYIKSVSAS